MTPTGPVSLAAPARIARDYAAVLLDLDGTLVDSQAAVHRAWRAWCERYDVRPGELDGLIHGRTATDLISRVRPAWPPQRVEESARFQLRFQEEDPHPGVAVPAASELLTVLGRGASWAVVTACTARLARHRLRNAGLPEPPVLVSVEDIAQGKPDPESYLLAAKLLAVDPADCLVVEDSPAGVSSGLAAGCTVAALSFTHDAEALTHASTTVSDLRALEFAGRPPRP